VGSTPSLASAPDKVRTALEAIRVFSTAVSHAERIASAHAMRRAVVDVVAFRGRLCDLWLKHAIRSEAIQLSRRCDACTNSTVLYRIDIGLTGIAPRFLRICPRCGFSLDAPSETFCSIHVDADGVVRLQSDVTGTAWAAAVTRQYRWPCPTDTWEWPTASDGQPATAWRMPPAGHSGAATITLTIMAGTRIALASRATRHTGTQSIGESADSEHVNALLRQ